MEVFAQWQQQQQQQQQQMRQVPSDLQPRADVGAAMGVPSQPSIEDVLLQGGKVASPTRLAEREFCLYPPAKKDSELPNAQSAVWRGFQQGSTGGLLFDVDIGASAAGQATLAAAPGVKGASVSGTLSTYGAPDGATAAEIFAEDNNSFCRLPEGSIAEDGAVVEAVAHRLGMFK